MKSLSSTPESAGSSVTRPVRRTCGVLHFADPCQDGRGSASGSQDRGVGLEPPSVVAEGRRQKGGKVTEGRRLWRRRSLLGRRGPLWSGRRPIRRARSLRRRVVPGRAWVVAVVAATRGGGPRLGTAVAVKLAGAGEGAPSSVSGSAWAAVSPGGAFGCTLGATPCGGCGMAQGSARCAAKAIEGRYAVVGAEGIVGVRQADGIPEGVAQDDGAIEAEAVAVLRTSPGPEARSAMRRPSSSLTRCCSRE